MHKERRVLGRGRAPPGVRGERSAPDAAATAMSEEKSDTLASCVRARVCVCACVRALSGNAEKTRVLAWRRARPVAPRLRAAPSRAPGTPRPRARTPRHARRVRWCSRTTVMAFRQRVA
jgi:hypothetical protein